MSTHNLSTYNAFVGRASTHYGTKSILSSTISNAAPSHHAQEWQSFVTPQGRTFIADDARRNAHHHTRAASTPANEDSFDPTVPQTKDEVYSYPPPHL